MFEFAPDAYYLSELKGNFIDGNKAAEEITGYKREELIGKSFLKLKLLPPEQILKASALLAKNALGRPTEPNEFTLTRKDGNKIQLEIKTFPVKIKGKNLVLGIARGITERKRAEEILRNAHGELEMRVVQRTADLTRANKELQIEIAERKRAEEALRSERHKLHALIDGLARTEIGIDIVGSDYKILFQNQTLKERFSDSTGKLCYKEYMGLRKPCDCCPMMKAAKSNKVESVELTGADQRNYQLFAVPLPNPDGTVDKAIEVVLDITERKQAEEALKESKQRLGVILQDSPIPAFVIDKNHKVIYWNAALEQCTGIKAKEVIGTEQHWKAFYNEKRPCMADLLMDEAAEEIPQWYPGRCSKSEVVEGAYEATDFFPTLGEGGKWLRFTAAMIRDSQGNLFGAIETLEDITKRKQAEELYETLANSPQIGVIVIQDGKMQFVNPYIQEYSGFSPDELLGMNALDFAHPEDREMVRENAIKMLKGERSSPYEFRAVNKDGQIRWVMETVTPIQYKGRRATLANYIDITEMKRAQEALKESEERYRTLFEDSRDAVYTVTRAGKLVDTNQSFSDLFGYTREEIRELQIQDLYVYPSDREGFQQEIEQKEAVRDYELKLHKKDRAEMDCLATSTLWRDKDGTILGYRGIIRDITEAKKADQELKHSFTDLAETVSRAMGSRDPYTANHQQRVARLARLVGEKMRLDKDSLQGLYIGGLLHDVGKISIPASILTKPGELSDEEWTLIQAHAKQGYSILKDTKLPWPIADMALHHHERLNGSGYPHGLKSDELSLENCILGVCDVVEAMSSYRPYRPARSKEEILEEIKSGRGTKYDPHVVDVMLQIIENEEFEFAWEGEASAATKVPVP